MLIGYMEADKADGLQALNPQREALLAAEVDPIRLYEDRASGRRDGCPGPESCLKNLHAGDTLVAWRLDRLRRDLRPLVKLTQEMTRRDVGLRVLAGEGAAIDCTSPNGGLASGVFAALAKFEQLLAAKRTRASRATERARGRRGHRHYKMTEAKLHLAQAAMGRRKTEVGRLCAELGVIRQTLYRHVDPQGQFRPDGEKLMLRHHHAGWVDKQGSSAGTRSAGASNRDD